MDKRKKKRRARRAFTPEFKAEAVRLCRVGDRTARDVAKDLDLTETALRDWVKRAAIDAGEGPPGALTSDERAELTQLRRENKRLQMEREILKKCGGLLREGEHVKFAFILAEKAFPITILCSVLEVSRSGLHAWRKRPLSRRARSDAQLAAHVTSIHERSRKTYGSPRVHAELKAKGVRVGKKRVERLMRVNGIQARRKRRFRNTTDSKHPHATAPSVVARKFDVAAPNRVWATDVTAIWTLEGWLFRAVMLDLYSRRVVGWAAGASNDTALATDALRAAIRTRRPAPGLTHHSDRGSPYASAEYRAVLARYGVIASMSRKGDCWDNAVAESFFATLRTELVDHERYLSHEGAMRSIGEYFEGFYNIERRHSHFDYLNPIELRSQSVQEVA